MRHRSFGALLLALPLSAAALAAGQSETASAAPEPVDWAGADGAGAILVGDQGSVEVEREHLIFSLSEFPDRAMESREEFAKYSGKFTAEYTFRNPTDEPKDLTLVFPLGALPEYFPYSEEEADRSSLGYEIKENGTDVPVTLRHTFNDRAYDRSGSFDVDGGIGQLFAPRKALYRDDSSITAYTYRVEVEPSHPIEGDESEFVNFSLSFGASAERTRVFSLEHCGYGVKDGRAKLTYGFPCRERSVLLFTVYVLGEDITEPETHVVRYENSGVVPHSAASVSVESKETAAFSEFALSFRGEKSVVSEEDWVSAFTDGIENRRYSKSCYSDFSPKELNGAGALLQWLEYSISIPANGRTVNSVTAPIYPTMDQGYTQVLYRYRYLLSPAQKWENFGELTIDIETPFYLSGNSLNFTKREGGYTLTRDSLPLGELDFILTEQERESDEYFNRPPHNGENGRSALVTAIIIMSVVVAGAAVMIVIVAIQSRKRRKRREEEEKRLLQTRPQEGKIDLPEDDNKSS